MNKEKVSYVVGGIDDKFVEEAALFASISNEKRAESKRYGKHTARGKWIAAAACLAAIAVLAASAFAVSAEAKEYSAAVDFFEDNGLSADGLSRREVKAVYRDITRKSFTLGKTAVVLHQTVPGWEFSESEPTPEEIAAMWDGYQHNNSNISSKSKSGVDYKLEHIRTFDEKTGGSHFEKSVLKCYLDGKETWSVEFTDFQVEGYSNTPEGTAVWGTRYDLYKIGRAVNDKKTANIGGWGWIAAIDEDGKIKWQHPIGHDSIAPHVCTVLSNGDGTWAIFCNTYSDYICFCCYDLDGNELSYSENKSDGRRLQNAVRVKDGYIVGFGNETIAKMDENGIILDNISYEADDCLYYINDMIEYEGEMYLSAYAYPKPPEIDYINYGSSTEIANIFDYVFKKEYEEQFHITSEELTPVVRDNYTAVLLVCDNESGTPKTFYSVKGAIGGKLFLNDDNKLEWNIESITSSYFSPFTDFYSIVAYCKVLRYTFDTNGTLIRRTDTGETTIFRR